MLENPVVFAVFINIYNLYDLVIQNVKSSFKHDIYINSPNCAEQLGCLIPTFLNIEVLSIKKNFIVFCLVSFVYSIILHIGLLDSDRMSVFPRVNAGDAQIFSETLKQKSHHRKKRKITRHDLVANNEKVFRPTGLLSP